MNIPAVTHRGRGIDCYPLDEHTFRIRLTTAKGDFDRAEICYCMNKYAWSTQRQTLPLPRIADDDTLDYYQIDLTGDDTRLCYLFLLYHNSECFYFSEEGLSRTYDFERAYYTFFQYPYIFPCNVHRHIPWTDTTVMYQIFPERFANGMGEIRYSTIVNIILLWGVRIPASYLLAWLGYGGYAMAGVSLSFVVGLLAMLFYYKSHAWADICARAEAQEAA